MGLFKSVGWINRNAPALDGRQTCVVQRQGKIGHAGIVASGPYHVAKVAGKTAWAFTRGIPQFSRGWKLDERERDRIRL